MFKIIESFVFNCLVKSTEEKFSNDSNSIDHIRHYSKLKMLAVLITLIMTQTLLLVIGKWLWNTYLINTVSGVKPINSVWQLLALSILFKLLFN